MRYVAFWEGQNWFSQTIERNLTWVLQVIWNYIQWVQ